MESNIITQVFLPLALFIIMMGMGLSLVVDDFRRVLRYPKAVAIGLAIKLLVIPIITFGLLAVIPLEPELAVGFILLAACPGGATTNLITHLAKGDVALSITLTAIASVITVFTIPLLVNLGLQHMTAVAQLPSKYYHFVRTCVVRACDLLPRSIEPMLRCAQGFLYIRPESNHFN